jgi:protein-S-isoprenylcysteine O-methyltransferase Ste14
MAVEETILQHWIFTKFILPFALIFAIIFALLEKTKVLGEGKQTDAIVALVIGLIFVGFAYPKDVVENMILFLTVALIVVFVALLLWGFVTGGEAKISDSKVKMVAGIVIGVVVLIALIWATGNSPEFLSLLFEQSWSSAFWTNLSFILIIAVALAWVLKGSKSS